jgi:hypothetical protein
MINRSYSKLFNYLLLCVGGVFIMSMLSSCGKSAVKSAAGLNIQYQILNLSPDLFAVDLYIDFKKQNNTSFIYGVRQGYFYAATTDTPYQIRSALVSGTTLLSRHDILKPNVKYTLFIVGNLADNSIKPIFTVDTSSLPVVGRGKIRFVNASPTGTGGLDVTANGTPAFSKIPYLAVSKYIEVPIGNYDVKINATGSPNILKDLPNVTIQDGRLYTLYTYGYTNRIDSAAFNAAVITNR